jgi:hypothetical protein
MKVICPLQKPDPVPERDETEDDSDDLHIHCEQDSHDGARITKQEQPEEYGHRQKTRHPETVFAQYSCEGSNVFVHRSKSTENCLTFVRTCPWR